MGISISPMLSTVAAAVATGGTHTEAASVAATESVGSGQIVFRSTRLQCNAKSLKGRTQWQCAGFLFMWHCQRFTS